jgi:hypothetical protein
MGHEQGTADIDCEDVFDLANLVAVALVFGQFVGIQEFSVGVFMLGIMVASALYAGGFILSTDKRSDENQ